MKFSTALSAVSWKFAVSTRCFWIFRTNRLQLSNGNRLPNPRNYPDVMLSAESGRPMYRGVKMITIQVNGEPFTFGQPGWWCSLDDPDDLEGQLVDTDNVIYRETIHRG